MLFFVIFDKFSVLIALSVSFRIVRLEHAARCLWCGILVVKVLAEHSISVIDVAVVSIVVIEAKRSGS